MKVACGMKKKTRKKEDGEERRQDDRKWDDRRDPEVLHPRGLARDPSTGFSVIIALFIIVRQVAHCIGALEPTWINLC